MWCIVKYIRRLHELSSDTWYCIKHPLIFQNQHDTCSRQSYVHTQKMDLLKFMTTTTKSVWCHLSSTSAVCLRWIKLSNGNKYALYLYVKGTWKRRNSASRKKRERQKIWEEKKADRINLTGKVSLSYKLILNFMNFVYESINKRDSTHTQPTHNVCVSLRHPHSHTYFLCRKQKCVLI